MDMIQVSDDLSYGPSDWSRRRNPPLGISWSLWLFSSSGVVEYLYLLSDPRQLLDSEPSLIQNLIQGLRLPLDLIRGRCLC